MDIWTSCAQDWAKGAILDWGRSGGGFLPDEGFPSISQWPGLEARLDNDGIISQYHGLGEGD